jgi:hypothetical protein
MSDDTDKSPKEEPKPAQESQETEIVLPEKDWQLALGNEKQASENSDDD